MTPDLNVYERALLDLSERLVDRYSGQLPADRVIAAFGVAHRQVLHACGRVSRAPTLAEYVRSVTELVDARLQVRIKLPVARAQPDRAAWAVDATA